MTFSQDFTHWSYGGVDFQTLGIRVRTMTGAFALPPLRGNDIPSAYATGQRWLPKVHDERTITLEMLIPQQGQFANSPDDWPGIQATLDTLAQLFGQYFQGDLIEYLPDSTSRTALAQVNAWAPASVDVGGYMYIGTVTFMLADPYFYMDEVTLTGLNSSGPSTLTHPGTVRGNNMVIVFTSATDPVLTNTTNGDTLTISPLPGGGVTVDCENWTCGTYEGDNSQINLVAHTGDFAFFVLEPGANVLTVSSGDVAITFQPPCL